MMGQNAAKPKEEEGCYATNREKKKELRLKQGDEDDRGDGKKARDGREPTKALIRG